MAIAAGTVVAAVQPKLDAAAKAKKVAFVLVYDQTALQLDQARGLVSEAIVRVPGSVKVECDRNDPANADFVAKLRLAGAPVPLILVCSKTGVLTGGLVAQQATVDKLVNMVPSPKKTQIIKALSEGHSVFITVSHKDMKSAESVFSTCAAACQQMADKSVQIQIDMNDPAESRFLTEMKVNRSSTEPVTLVVNAQGQIAGIYTGAMQVTDLVTAASKKIGGCCPPTVAKPDASCEPKKK